MRATVRRATAADVATIVALGLEFYATTGWRERAPFCEHSAAATARNVIDNGFILLAEVDGDPVGMVGVYVAPFALNLAYKSGTEVMWYVAPEARSGGAAIKLLRQAPIYAKARGAAWLTMGVLADSPPQAAALYERLGYRPVETSYLLEL